MRPRRSRSEAWVARLRRSGLRVARLFTIKTKFEAFLVIYGLGLGAAERGVHYMQQYPGWGGRLLFAVCPIAVFMAGGCILESVDRRRDG